MSKKKTRRSFSQQYKKMAVGMHRDEGYSRVDVARRLGIHRSMVERWERELFPEDVVTPETSTQQPQETQSVPDQKDREIQRLREENRKLLEEKEVLKKATAFFAREQN